MRIIKKTTLYIVSAVLLLGLGLTSFAFHPALEETQEIERELNKVFPTWPKVNYGTGSDAKLIKRGEYLAKAGDCLACHTNLEKNGAPFAGGLPLATPFGTFYSPNITPDKETGIGNWTEKDFIRAMHDGRRPDGSNYFPVFPYLYFNKISEDDLRAIWAYMKAIPPVKQATPKNGVPFPFNVRFAQWGWKLLFFYPYSGTYEYDEDQSAAWNKGAYLVQGLGHCAMCHTPLNPLGAPKREYELAGGFIEGYWAPNINHYGLKTVTIAQVAQVFATDKLLNRAGRVSGPMSEVNHASLQHLTAEDQVAIATYLKTVQSKHQFHIPPAAKKQATLSRGRQVYESVCYICHQNGKEGAPVIGDTANWKMRLTQTDEGLHALYRHTINGYNLMPVRGACVNCSNEDIEAAVDFLLSRALTPQQLKQEEAREEATKPTLEDGKQVYKESCAVCHDAGKLGAPKIGDKEQWQPLLKQNFEDLIQSTLQGKGDMPKKGGCDLCTREEVIAAVKYLAQESSDNADYKLW
ncbi:MAG: c-type cytochrome [Proteobacteria bacterium]|nr:c-type cytochrome [Pseudomonadota bacterium]